MNRPVVLIAICSAMVGVSYGMHSPIVPVFAREQLAAGYSQVGLIGAVNYLPYMFAPFFVGILLDRLNKSYVLLSGILLNVFSIFLLSTVQSILEIMHYRVLTGVAHALFWPPCEVLISINSSMDRLVRNISVFIAAWVLGFMVRPIIGKAVLNVFDYYTLFQLAAVIMTVGIVPSILLRSYGWPAVQKDLEVRANSVELAKEMATHPTLAGVILYYAMTFGVVLAVYPVSCVYERRIAYKPRHRANILRFWYIAFCYSSTACEKDIEIRCACTCTGCFDYCNRYDHFFFIEVDSIVCSINCVIRPFD
jgi:MFS family permease